MDKQTVQVVVPVMSVAVAIVAFVWTSWHQTKALRAQTYLHYVDRLEQMRPSRYRIRRALADWDKTSEPFDSPERWKREHDAHKSLITQEKWDEASRSLWADADAIARAYDLLGAAYESKVIAANMSDLIYLPMFHDFWVHWLRAFTVAERNRRHDVKHLHAMVTLRARSEGSSDRLTRDALLLARAEGMPEITADESETEVSEAEPAPG